MRYLRFGQEFAMSTILPDVPPSQWTIADVQARLSGFPAHRIRTCPAPGTATEEDLLRAESQTGRICELIDGTLVEKTVASYESMLAVALGYFLYSYLDKRNLGVILGADGMLKILPGQVRVPDVSFIRWERFSGNPRGDVAIYALSPDLAVEILSEGNTEQEMARKLHEYFLAGVQLVWYIEPRSRTARAYTAEHEWTELGVAGSLLGGAVLPDFALPLAELFARVERPQPE
jgi:Uma2 family endonuclease